MSAVILDGKKLADEILSGLKDEITQMDKQIKLAVVLVGGDPGSAAYVERKKKAGEKIGVEVSVYKYTENVSPEELKAEIAKLNNDKNITGIIVQLPLPAHMPADEVLNIIKPEKDVDVLTPQPVEALKLLPPTVAGIIKLLEAYNIEIKGKTAAVVGQGRLVGKPASIAFEQIGAVVLAIDEFTENKEELIKKADIIVSGVGKPGLITKNMVKEGAVVIDAGTTAENGKLIGDVAEDIKDIASYITPVPGGVGPMTVAMLFWNLVELSR